MEKLKMSWKKLTIIAIGIILFIFFLFNTDRVGFIFKVFTPVIGGIFLAYLLDAAVRMMVKKWKFKRWAAILTTFILLILIIALLLTLIIPQIINNIESIFNIVLKGNSELSESINNIKNVYDNQYANMVGDELIEFEQQVKNIIKSVKDYLTSIIIPTTINIASTVLVVFTTFILSIYMLIEKNDLLARLRRAIFAYFNEAKARKIIKVSSQANTIFKNYIIGKIIDSTIVAILNVIFFAIFGVPNAILMGVVIGFCNLIPYFGPIIGTIPVVLITLVISPIKALVAVVIIIVIGQIDANFIDPKIVGENTGVSPFWVIASVTVGGAAFGFAGMLFSVPIVILIKTIIEENVSERLREKGLSELEIENLRKEKSDNKRFFKKKVTK